MSFTKQWTSSSWLRSPSGSAISFRSSRRSRHLRRERSEPARADRRHSYCGAGFWDPAKDEELRGGKMLSIEVLRANLLQVRSIDQVNQSFKARVFLQLVVRGGGLDPALSSSDEAFPKTGRPSVAWYLKQLHFPNAANLTWLEAKVVPMASSREVDAPLDDLHLVLRVDGEFHQAMLDSRSVSEVFAAGP